MIAEQTPPRGRGPAFLAGGGEGVAAPGVGGGWDGGIPRSWPWGSSLASGNPSLLEPGFFLRDAAVVARDLLGRCIRSRVGGVDVLGVVVETEAYPGPEDPASHAAARVGPTRRNRSMFGPPGRAYVFRSYGIHSCLNVVTGSEGFPAAVLIRALDPLSGVAAMSRRREGRKPVASGPGRVGQALGITAGLDGHPLDRPPLELLDGWAVPDALVAASGRVGIRQAADWPLRFFLRGHPEVSPGPREQPVDSYPGR